MTQHKTPDDFTFYIPRAEAPTSTAPETDAQATNGADSMETRANSAETSIANTIRFDIDVALGAAAEPDDRRLRENVTARALVCPCFRGQYLSATCRKLEPKEGQPADTGAVEWNVRPTYLVAGGERLLAEPKSDWDHCKLNLVGRLWSGLELNQGRWPTGLIVVAGRTGSGKSQITRAFIHQYMDHMVEHGPKGRRPHLLTYEDPIEELILASPDAAAGHGIDYTPREKKKDVAGLAEATRDALRQTPSLFFVGETRDEQDWKELLRFAGTGHLTITTGHAGSLVETMAQMLQAAGATTPAERSHVAGRVAALVHIRPHPVAGDPDILIPSFWFRTSRSISTFTAEGLGSLLPNRPAGKTARDSFGRAHAVENLDYLSKRPDKPRLLEQAIEWDLAGA